MIYCLLLFAVYNAPIKRELFCATSHNQAVIKCTVPVSEIQSISLKSFTRLSIAGAGISDKIGAPELPVIRKFVAIPVCANVEIESRILNTETISLNSSVYPRQPPISKSYPEGIRNLTIDQDCYKLNNFLPFDRVRIARICELRGLRVALVEIYPATYNAYQNRLEVATDIEVTLKFISPNWASTGEKFSRLNNPSFGQKLVLNQDFYKNLTKSGKSLPLPIGYLIITPDEYYTNILPLKNWKTKKGYYATITKLSELSDSTPAGIRTYINSAYTGWSIPPTFVLLVGDTDKIGYFVYAGSENIHTDLNYSLMDTLDYLPDLYISRFSIASATQLDSLVNKTIKYERNDWSSDSSWCKKAYFIGSADGGNHLVAESTHIYCMARARANGMLCDSLFLYYSSGTPIATAVNNGASWVIYSGHGSTTMWQDAGFSTTNVHSLLNVDKVPFVASFACYNGNFSTGECFTESWERVGYRGAIVCLGSSVSSYWDEDDYLQRRMFDVMLDSGRTWIMGGINTAKMLLYQYYGDVPTMHDYFTQYNLIGDGSVDIYSDIPHPITVDYAKKLPLGGCTLSVFVKDNGYPVKNALVCAQTDSIYVGYTDSVGNVKLPMSIAQPCTGQITVTGHNLRTYEGNLAIVDVEEGLPAINGLKLHASPNPSNKGLIEFTLQGILPYNKGLLSLNIYDLGGRIIKTFTITPAYNSSFSIKWDRKDNEGKQVCAGVYFYRLQSKNTSSKENATNSFVKKTEKLILL